MLHPILGYVGLEVTRLPTFNLYCIYAGRARPAFIPPQELLTACCTDIVKINQRIKMGVTRI